MSLITVIGLNVALDVAILAALTYVCRLPRHLAEHQQQTPGTIEQLARTPELAYEQEHAA